MAIFQQLSQEERFFFAPPTCSLGLAGLLLGGCFGVWRGRCDGVLSCIRVLQQCLGRQDFRRAGVDECWFEDLAIAAYFELAGAARAGHH